MAKKVSDEQLLSNKFRGLTRAQIQRKLNRSGIPAEREMLRKRMRYVVNNYPDAYYLNGKTDEPLEPSPGSPVYEKREKEAEKIRRKHLKENRVEKLVTIEDLIKAIKESVSKDVSKEMKDREATAMAQHVMGHFGYQERIIDNTLETEDRDAFYMLEDSGILTTEREETTLYDGREWRIHYWLFNKNKIKELKTNYDKTEEIKEDAGAIYGEISEDIWQREGIGINDE
jgi:hypothetical protein